MEGRCIQCGQDVLFLRKPRYEGFTRVGETLTCSRCGAAQPASSGSSAPSAVPPPSRKPSLFDADDLPRPVRLFDDGENKRLCRYCTHYLVNPFTQRCALHNKVIQATDTCRDFSAKG